MKKYLLILAWMAMSFFLFIGCSNSANSISVKNPEGIVKENILSESPNTTDRKTTTYETLNNLQGVTITVKKETVSPNGVTIIFENKSEKTCIYGEKFELEKKISGKWYQVPVAIEGNYGFNSIGYELGARNQGEWKVEWKWLYGSLESGEYRIVKDILDFRKTGDYDTYFLAAEFII